MGGGTNVLISVTSAAARGVLNIHGRQSAHVERFVSLLLPLHSISICCRRLPEEKKQKKSLCSFPWLTSKVDFALFVCFPSIFLYQLIFEMNLSPVWFALMLVIKVQQDLWASCRFLYLLHLWFNPHIGLSPSHYFLISLLYLISVLSHHPLALLAPPSSFLILSCPCIPQSWMTERNPHNPLVFLRMMGIRKQCWGDFLRSWGVASGSEMRPLCCVSEMSPWMLLLIVPPVTPAAFSLRCFRETRFVLCWHLFLISPG